MIHHTNHVGAAPQTGRSRARRSERITTAAGGTTAFGSRGTVLAVSGAPVAMMNAVISTSLEPDVAEMARLADCDCLRGLPWSIQVRGNPTPRVLEPAARHGLTAVHAEPLMVREAARSRPADADPGAVGGSLRVRRVPVGGLALFAKMVADGFGVPHELLRFFADPSVWYRTGYTPYLAEIDGVPVGTGMTAVSDGLNGVSNVTTRPHRRRRGIGREIVLEMIRAGFDAGATTAYLYASEMAVSLYESVGFEHTGEAMTAITGA
jgi:GNAT superfamily N-acetyltransferase